MISILNKTSLGIDISEDQISVALLKKTGDGIELRAAAQCAVPKGSIVDGNIVDPESLARAIKTLLKSNRIRTRKAVVSLVAKPSLVRIIDLPEDMPENVGHFVQSEIKHSAILAGKDSHFDYCGLGLPGSDITDRTFVAATDKEKISALLKTMSLAKIDATEIELPVVASMRTIYANKISGSYDVNLLKAYVHGSVIAISVFRRSTLDFIRCVDIGNEDCDTDQYAYHCINEINTVMQYYDIEVENASGCGWEIVTVLENPEIDGSDFQFVLQKELGGKAEVCTPSNIYQYSCLAQNDSIEKASITAVGLALKAFHVPDTNLNINLIPPEVKEMRATRKFILINANILAAVLLVMLMIAGLVSVQLGRTQKAMEERKLNGQEDNIEYLLERQRSLNEKISHLSEKKDGMNLISGSGNVSTWAGLLDDIRKRTPSTLYITRLYCYDGLYMVVEGESLSFKSIHIFGELLSESELIESAVVSETNKSHDVEGVVIYSINCVLKDRIGLQANAD